MRLIDADALKEVFKETDVHYGGKIKELIDEAPTMSMPTIQAIWESGYFCGLNDTKPRPRPHREWIDHSDEGYVECPFCGSATNCEDNKEELHYCWNCGAYMRQEEATDE